MRMYNTEEYRRPTRKATLHSFESGRGYKYYGKEITKGFDKAKKMVVSRLQQEIVELQEQLDYINSLTVDTVPSGDNPYE